VGTPLGENALDTKVGPELDGNGANPRVEVRDTIAFGFTGFITNQGAFNMKEDIDATIDGVTVYDTEVAFRLRFPANVAVYNAVVWGVDNVIRYEDGLADARFINATIGEAIGADVFEDGGGGGQTGMVLDNVLVLGDALPALLEGTASLLAGEEQFVDAAGHDYRLVEGASAIDAGMMYAEVASDRVGVARPYGDAWDIGAFEWSPAGAEDTGGVDTSGGGDDSGSGSASGSGSGSASASGSGSGSASGSDGATEAGSEGSAGMGDEGGGDGCNCNTGARWHPAILGLLFATAARRRRR
jgi:MYXO-CTERM domain-containing protein